MAAQCISVDSTEPVHLDAHSKLKLHDTLSMFLEEVLHLVVQILSLSQRMIFLAHVYFI